MFQVGWPASSLTEVFILILSPLAKKFGEHTNLIFRFPLICKSLRFKYFACAMESFLKNTQNLLKLEARNINCHVLSKLSMQNIRVDC